MPAGFELPGVTAPAPRPQRPGVAPACRGLAALVGAAVLLAAAAVGNAQEPRAEPLQTLFDGTGLRNVSTLLATPDGRHLYAAAGGDRALVAFARDDSRGRLSAVAIYREGAGGIAGIAAIGDMALSADGRNLYAVGADTITLLRRDSASGELALEQSLRGGFEVTQLFDVAIAEGGDVLYAGGANAIAVFSIDDGGRLTHRSTLIGGRDVEPLAGRVALAVSRDGRHLYATSDFGRSLLAFEPTTGSLEVVQTLTDDDVPSLGTPSDLLLSHDDRHVYVAVGDRDRIAVFERDPTSGTLTASGSVEEADPGRGLAAPTRMALSADGNRMYVASSFNDTIAVLTRDAASGSLSPARFETNGQAGVVGIAGSADIALGPGQSHVYVAGASSGSIGLFDAALTFLAVERNSSGAVVGMRRPSALAVTPDAAHVYVTGFESGAIAIFARRDDGTLVFQEVFRGSGSGKLIQPIDLAVSSDGTVITVADFGSGSLHNLRRDGGGSLATIATIDSNRIADLRGVSGVALSPDDRTATAVSVLRGAATLLDIAPADKAMALRATMSALTAPSSVTFSRDGANLYTASSGSNAVLVFETTVDGPFSSSQTLRNEDLALGGLVSPAAISESADGRHVYVVAGAGIFQLEGSNSVGVFVRDQLDGTLTQRQVLTDGEEGADGLLGASAVAVSADGATVVVAGFTGNSIAVFERNRSDGELTFLESYVDGIDGADGLAGASALAFSPDGTELYVTGFADNALSVFSVATKPSCPGDCDDSGSPGITELVRCVSLAVAAGEQSSCPACDVDGDGRVGINELIQAVNAALTGCP